MPDARLERTRRAYETKTQRLHRETLEQLAQRSDVYAGYIADLPSAHFDGCVMRDGHLVKVQS